MDQKLKKELKEKLENEKNLVLAELSKIGVFDPATGQWEAMPEAQDNPEADENDQADRAEGFEERTSMMKILRERLNEINKALEFAESKSFGICKICNAKIEVKRLEANPAAQTCITHRNELVD